MKNLSLYCVDLNTPYCPCLLAETNHCVFCSQLKGETGCNCNWQGVCVLYEKHWKNNKRAEDSNTPIRSEIQSSFTIVAELAKDISMLKFAVPLELAQQLEKPGAFVFLRAPQDEPFFHFPVGVMKVIDSEVYVVIEKIGPKSARLFSHNNELLVRAPYYNGIFGQPWIDKIMNGKILLIAGGMGQPPALPAAKKLSQNNNEIVALLAPGKAGKVFIDTELTRLGASVHNVISMRKNGMPLLQELLKEKPDLIVSAGPDEQHYAIINVLQDQNIDIPMAATNNAPMCCGEGICGSCIKDTNDNKKIRTCKVQTDFTYLIPY